MLTQDHGNLKLQRCPTSLLVTLPSDVRCRVIICYRWMLTVPLAMTKIFLCLKSSFFIHCFCLPATRLSVSNQIFSLTSITTTFISVIGIGMLMPGVSLVSSHSWDFKLKISIDDSNSPWLRSPPKTKTLSLTVMAA